jgi:hypothetical protein
MNAPAARGRQGHGRSAAGPGAAVALATLLVTALAAPAGAQLPYLSPLPAWTPADSLAGRACEIDLTRFGDGRTGWISDRLTVEGRLPFGRHGCVLLRLPFLRSDSAGLPAADRWPAILGPGAAADWPQEAVTAGFGQAELGLAGPLSLPLLGPLSGALVAGVPLGDSRAYPWSSAGLPARVGATRWFAPRPGWWLGLGATAVTHAGPGRQEFAPEAFPDGWSSSLVVEHTGRAHGLRLAWEAQSRGGRHAQEVALAAWVPWQGAGRLGLRVAREITGSADRAAAWSVGLTCRVAARPAAAAPRGARPPGGNAH